MPFVEARQGERIKPVGMEMPEATILIIEDDDELSEVIEAKLTKRALQSVAQLMARPDGRPCVEISPT